MPRHRDPSAREVTQSNIGMFDCVGFFLFANVGL
jgi:hypothetical protein